MQCRFCGNENNDSSTNCFICGKPLATNIATSLVNMGSAAETKGVYSINGNDAHANRFASDTGGGPAVGPQSFSAQIMAGNTTTQKKGGAGVLIIILLLLVLIAAVGWYLFFSPVAPMVWPF